MNTKTKTGAASLYIVIFTTLLLGIITLGFIRIMLSEASQTSNADLSQSAFDSALAGVEDAKVALLKYHECLSNNDTSTSCQNAIASMQAQDSTTNCDLVRNVLGREYDIESGETIIQTGTDGTGQDMQQAYTCVLIAEDTTEYVGQLNDSYHSKMIPLRTTNINELRYVRVEWYSNKNISPETGQEPNMPNRSPDTLDSTNKPNNDTTNIGLFSKLTGSDDTPAPPTLGVQLIQTNNTFSIADLDTNKGNDTNRGTLILYPSASAPGNIIASTTSSGFSASSDKAYNTPTPIRCEPNDAQDINFFCTAVLAIPAPYNGNVNDRSESSSFLRLFLPYGTPPTDFHIFLCKDNPSDPCGINTGSEDDLMPFVGVQARIDSTGRANDLFRRIESRVELVDVYFPFPEYVVTIRGTEVDVLNKNFWITKNNWGGADSGCLTGELKNNCEQQL